jgi:ankyrin repeat protein
MSYCGLTPEQTERIVAIAMDLARHGSTAQQAEFIDHGLPVDASDADTNTLLMLAAYHAHVDTVHAKQDEGPIMASTVVPDSTRRSAAGP